MIVRTTVCLPADLLNRAKRKAAAERHTLTSLIEEGLRSVLADSRKTQARSASDQQGDRRSDACN
jgi:hypothetical protein